MGYSTMTPLCRKIVAMPLITLEGSEGCGKSTQVKRLAARLEKWGIRPAVLREPGGAARWGEWVICDRFFDLTTVYQGAARQLDLGLVEKLNAFAVGDCVPNLTFVLDIDRANAQSRLGNQKKIRDRMEEESDEFHKGVIPTYRELAKNEPRRVILIDGRVSPDTIENQIWNTFVQRFPDLGTHQTPKTKRQTP